jgi:hypothetical protein
VVKFLISRSMSQNVDLSFSSFQLNDRMMSRLQRDQEEEDDDDDDEEEERMTTEEIEQTESVLRTGLEENESEEQVTWADVMTPPPPSSPPPLPLGEMTFPDEREDQESNPEETEEETEEVHARDCIVSYDLRGEATGIEAMSSDDRLLAAWDQVQQVKRGMSLGDDQDQEKREEEEEEEEEVEEEEVEEEEEGQGGGVENGTDLSSSTST